MKKKLEMTQVGDVPATMKKWKEIYNRSNEFRNCKDLEKLGEIVYVFAHFKETRQVITTGICDEKFIESLSVPEMADFLRNELVYTFYIWSINDKSASFEVHFVISEDKTKVEYIVCADHTTGMACVVTDFVKLPEVLKKFMQLDNLEFNKQYDFSEN